MLARLLGFVSVISVPSATSFVPSLLVARHQGVGGRATSLFGNFFEEDLPSFALGADGFDSSANELASSPSDDDTTSIGSPEKRSSGAGRRRSFVRAGLALFAASKSEKAGAAGLGGFFSRGGDGGAGNNSPVVYCDESVMSKKEHGTTSVALDPSKLIWNVDAKLADKICCFNRHFAEPAGTFQGNAAFLKAVEDLKDGETITFYDTVYNNVLFTAPKGRTKEQFLKESMVHGWPSFRDEEVNWDTVRVLSSSGETVSVGGTHLGHNLPDRSGNRYCINLCCVAGSGNGKVEL